MVVVVVRLLLGVDVSVEGKAQQKDATRREEKRGEERRREEKATRGLVCLRRGKLRTVGEREKQGKGG